MAAAAIGMTGPPAGPDPGPHHANDAALDVPMLARAAAEVALTLPLAPSDPAERRGGEIAPEDGSRPRAAPAPSQGEPRDPLEVRIEMEMDNVQPSETVPSIWRVHPSLRTQEPEAYEPKLVSIGPLHRDDEYLRPMEDIKLRYLKDLLGRSTNNILSNYVSKMRACELQARKEYAEEVNLDKEEFVRMLVLDGCFIIEYFVKRVFKQRHDVSGVRWGLAHLRRDLMLLENQIPFFVLVALFDKCTIPHEGSRKEPLTLMEIALAFLKIKPPKKDDLKEDGVLHLLHLHRLCLIPPDKKEKRRRCSFRQVLSYPFKKAGSLISLVVLGLLYLLLTRKWPWRCSCAKKKSDRPRMIPCATELDGAGVKFKKKVFNKGREGSDSYLEVSFEEGTLKIPHLSVQETTSSELRNFIALEQCCPLVGSHFTSYGVFMDNIINTESDVAILRKFGIMESKLGSDKEVANMFNTLCKGTHLDYKTHYNGPLFEEVTKYCEFAHHTWRANLVRTYFSNPWSFISLVAAAALLGLTATQTHFTIHPPPK